MNGGNVLEISMRQAPADYLSNPFENVAREAHELLNRYLASAKEPERREAMKENDLSFLLSPRNVTENGRIPSVRAKLFIPQRNPIEILACIDLVSYRVIWDTRLASGRILERYGHHAFLFYCVWRGVGPIYSPRDAVGIQHIRCWDLSGKKQAEASSDTGRIDIVWKSCDRIELPPQEGKVRARIELGAYRIQYLPEQDGCDVTFVAEAELGTCIPAYLYKTLTLELPRVLRRLSGAINRFGVPPYVLDMQDCLVIQSTSFDGDSRISKHRHQVHRPGCYRIIVDKAIMFPDGICPPEVKGKGAHAVALQERGDALEVDVSHAGIGQLYTIKISPSGTSSCRERNHRWW